jgi:hypothetical protein
LQFRLRLQTISSNLGKDGRGLMDNNEARLAQPLVLFGILFCFRKFIENLKFFSNLGNAVKSLLIETVLSKDDIEIMDEKYCFIVDLDRINVSV